MSFLRIHFRRTFQKERRKMENDYTAAKGAASYTDNDIKAMKNRGNRISGLDGLRTLAITGVTLFHMFPQTFKGGWLGVSLFFVLTGFLLAYTGEKGREKRSFSLLSYGWKRIKRIYPSLIIMILLTVGVYSFFAPDIIKAVRPEVLSVLLGFNNWWQIGQNADYFTRIASQSPFTHLWFLGIEIQYYLLWPLLYGLYIGISKLLNPKAGTVFFLLAGLGAMAVMPYDFSEGMDMIRLYYGTDTRIYALLLGAALGFCISHKSLETTCSPWKKKILSFLYGAALLVTGAGYLFLDGQLSMVYEWAMAAYTVLFLLLLAWTADPSLPMGKLMDNPLFRWIGKYSYGLFLWQYPVIFLFRYMKWEDAMPYGMEILEIALMALLALWTELLAGLFTGHIHFSFHPRKTVIQAAAILLISLPAFPFMAYGCRGIWNSADSRVSDMGEMKERFAENEKMLEAQQVEAIPVPEETKTQSRPTLDHVACMGDSVMLGSAMALRDVLPDCYIDAKVSRYVGAGLDIARQMDRMGVLGNTVVISLGTNGPLDGQYEGQTKGLLDYLGPDRHIFWVTVHCPATGWQDSNNAYLRKIATEYPNVTLVDWQGEVTKHPEWLGGDDIHPNNEGTAAYAGLIHDAIAAKM